MNFFISKNIKKAINRHSSQKRIDYHANDFTSFQILNYNEFKRCLKGVCDIMTSTEKSKSNDHNFDEYISFLKEKQYYLYPQSVQFILNTIAEEISSNEKTKVIGIDADSGYGKSFNAKYLYTFINKSNFLQQTHLGSLFEEQPVVLPESLKKIPVIYISLDQYDTNCSYDYILFVLYKAISDFLKKYQDKFNKDVYDYDINEIVKDMMTSLKSLSKAVIEDTKYEKILKYGSEIFNFYKNANKNKIKKLQANKKANLLEDLQSFIESISKMNPMIIIDNLDKCVPQFAIEFMNIVKYFFKDSKITFVIMINFEYLQNLAQGQYGNQVDLQFFYSLMFTRITKMYLKPKTAFINDIIESLRLDNYASLYEDSNYRNNFNELHRLNSLSLFELEKLILRFEKLLSKNKYLLNKKIEIAEFIDSRTLLTCIYSFMILQITNIKEFNKILYDEKTYLAFGFDEIENKLKNNENEKKYSESDDFYIHDDTIIDCFDSNKPLKHYFDVKYLSTIGAISINDYEISEISHQDNCVLIRKQNSQINNITSVSVEDFCISKLYGYEDTQLFSLKELFDFTFREYLRFKISQV